MRPTWCGPMPRTPRSSTTLPNRHQRQLCRRPTPARRALAMVRPWPQRRLVDVSSSLVAVAGSGSPLTAASRWLACPALGLC
jgi:hypothetical protein